MIYGLLTSVLNWVVFFPCYNLLGLSEVVRNCLALFAAVTCAFITNKLFVFSSRSWAFRRLLREIVMFYGCRLFSGALETVLLYVTVTELGYNGNIMKLLLSGLISIINFLGSKLLAFRKTKNEGHS